MDDKIRNSNEDSKPNPPQTYSRPPTYHQPTVEDAPNEEQAEQQSHARTDNPMAYLGQSAAQPLLGRRRLLSAPQRPISRPAYHRHHLPQAAMQQVNRYRQYNPQGPFMSADGRPMQQTSILRPYDPRGPYPPNQDLSTHADRRWRPPPRPLPTPGPTAAQAASRQAYGFRPYQPLSVSQQAVSQHRSGPSHRDSTYQQAPPPSLAQRELAIAHPQSLSPSTYRFEGGGQLREYITGPPMRLPGGISADLGITALLRLRQIHQAPLYCIEMFAESLINGAESERLDAAGRVRGILWRFQNLQQEALMQENRRQRLMELHELQASMMLALVDAIVRRTGVR